MNREQFEMVQAKESIFGQWVSILSVTEQEKNVLPEYKGLGIVKVTKLQAHIRKQEYMDVLNTSTGAVEMGIEFKPKRESYYDDIGHNGFLRSLKSDPSKLYIELRFNENDSLPEYSILIDKDNKVYDNTILKVKNKNARQVLADTCKVSIRQFKIESIAKMRVCGLDLIDESLIKYQDIAGMIFESKL